MFMRRRRPLLRAAMVGGGAYYAGKKVQQGREQDADQDARIQNLEDTPATPSSGAISDQTIEQLQKLGDLKKQGVLTEDEFEQQKQKLLQPA
jgi:putative oligomerization/nucleic acid binding protein